MKRFTLQVMMMLVLTGGCATSAPGNDQARASSSPPVPAASLFDAETPLKTRIRLAPFLTFGGKAEVEYILTSHATLPSGATGDFAILAPELSLALWFDPRTDVRAFLEVKLLGEISYIPEEKDQREFGFELTEAFLLFKHLWDGRLALQLGRQKFEDGRQWLYDAELDAVRALHRFPQGAVELAVSKGGLVGKDVLRHQSTDQHNTYLVYGHYVPHKTLRLGAYVLFREDRSAAHESPVFFGLHADGALVQNLRYWFEGVHVRGKDGPRQIRGFGVDLGGTYVIHLPFEPAVTLGYAFGTGDGDPEDDTDTRFRQTGLQGNKGKFNGVTGFQYYGELFDPELSNLVIWTAGLGIKPSRRSSVDVVYHAYQQHKAADHLREAGIATAPGGRHTSLGREIDMIFGYKEIKSVELTVVLGSFIPGKAFPNASASSFFCRFNVELAF